jgi:hypothetical protein
MANSELEKWRASFASYNGGPVEVLGWRRGGNEGDDSLSFWFAGGRSAHRACSYSTANPTGLLEELSERFGSSANLDKCQFGTTAFWKLGQMDVSFSQAGSNAVLYIAHLA